MSRLLVTGATGFIGSRVANLLAATGHDVHAITSSKSRPDRSSSLSWHHADLFEPRGVTRVVEDVRPEVLAHFAWLTTPGIYLDSDENPIWLRASLALTESVVRAGARRVVWAGTCLEYDVWADAPFVEGVTPTRPESPYAMSKHALAGEIGSAAPGWGIEHCWGRIFNLYGPGEHPSRLVAGTIAALAQGHTMSLSEGLQQRDFLHVNDVARAMVTLIESDHTGPVNVSSGEGIPVRDVALRIGEVMGRAELVKPGTRPSTDPEPPAIVGDNSLLASLGWSREIDWEDGLADAIRRSSQKTDV